MLDKIKRIGSILRSDAKERFKYFGSGIRQTSPGRDKSWIVFRYDLNTKSGKLEKLKGTFEDDAIWELAIDTTFTTSLAASYYLCGSLCKASFVAKNGALAKKTKEVEEKGLSTIIANTIKNFELDGDKFPILCKYLAAISDNGDEITEHVRTLKEGECIDILIDGKPWYRAEGILDEIDQLVFSRLTTPSTHDPNYHIVWNSIIESHKLFKPKGNKRVNSCPDNDPEKSYISLPIKGQDDFLDLWYGSTYIEYAQRRMMGNIKLLFIPSADDLKLEHIVRFMKRKRKDVAIESTADDERCLKDELSSSGKEGSWEEMWSEVATTFDEPFVTFDVVMRIDVTDKRTVDALTFSNISRSRVIKVADAIAKAKMDMVAMVNPRKRAFVQKSSFFHLVNGPMFKVGKFSHSIRYHTAWISELIEGQEIRSGREMAINLFIQNSLKTIRNAESNMAIISGVTDNFISVNLINNMKEQTLGTTESAELGRVVGRFFYASKKTRPNLLGYVNSIEGYLDINAKSLNSVHEFISSFIERMKRNDYHEDEKLFSRNVNNILGAIDRVRRSGSYDKSEFIYGFLQEKYVEFDKRMEAINEKRAQKVSEASE